MTLKKGEDRPPELVCSLRSSLFSSGARRAALHGSIYFIAYVIGSKFHVNWVESSLQSVLVLSSLRLKHS